MVRRGQTACAEKLSGNIRGIAPGDQVEVMGIPIQTIPAYNIDKFRESGEPYHPQEAGVGFIFTIGGQASITLATQTTSLR